MYGPRPGWKSQPRHARVLTRGLWSAAGGILLALWLLCGTANAAAPRLPGDAVTLTFTAVIQPGTVPSNILFWLCADPQADGTGCFLMSSQPDGSFTYQLATATGITYHHLQVAWTRGSQPTAKPTAAATRPAKTPTAQPTAPPLPALPLHTICSYAEITVSGPKSFACKVDASLFTTTPTPGTVDPAPTSAPGNAPPPVDRDTATLITGLQIVIGVGLVLLVILIPVLIWQRMSRRHR